MACTTLIDLLYERAAGCGEQVAYTFLEDGSQAKQRLSYGALYQSATQIAARLQSTCAVGDRALLLYPNGVEFLAGFFGCLLAGVVAIPAPAPEASRARRATPRLQGMLNDAGASLVLSTSTIRTGIEEFQVGLLAGRAVRWIDTDLEDSDPAAAWQQPAIGPSSLAYLQYTSGSTSSPRGVMISHRNLLEHLHYLQNTCGYDRQSATVAWMPYYHDYGLIEGLLEPLYNSTPAFVMTPWAFVKRPISWLRAISDYRATHSQGPNFAYSHCVRYVTAEQSALLDLSSWQAAGIAAEPINPSVMRGFTKRFEPHGFQPGSMCPAYGLAEATLMVSFSPKREPPVVRRFQAAGLEQRRVLESFDETNAAREIASCGRLHGSTSVEIVNPETKERCGPDKIGEIWVRDKTIAEGYWNRPTETEETFAATIEPSGEGPYLRTGDLGFIREGELFVTGRIKDLIIIRGVNHYPQDIEWTVQKSDDAFGAESGAAFSIIIDGEEKLVVAQELERKQCASIDGPKVIRSICDAVSREHEIDVFAVILLKRGGLPKTTSGKIQRLAFRTLYLDNQVDALFQWTAKADRPFSRVEGAALDRHGGAPTSGATGSSSSETEQGAGEMASVESSGLRCDALINWLRDYAEARINSRLIDERRCIPPYIVLDFGNQGLLGMQVPERFGGLGLRYRDTFRVLEQLAAVDLTIATLVLLNNTNGIRPIQYFAAVALRDELLPLLAKGRELAAFGLSEPGAGSNLGALATTATGDHATGWRLQGVKRWNSSSWAGVISVFARMVDSSGRLGRLTGFAVRQGAAGLRVGPEALTMGLRGSVQNALFLNNVAVGSAQVLGEIGGGFAVVEDALGVSRLGTAAVSVGAMKRCAQLMMRYATRREISTGPLLQNAVTLGTFSHVVARIAAIECLLEKVAALLDGGQRCPSEIAMVAKVAATDSLNSSAAELTQMLGGRGYMENNYAPQILRDARALSIGEGPNESLLLHIGRVEAHTQSISRFLQDHLEALTLADSLRSAAVELSQAADETQLSDKTIRIQRIHALIGRLAIDAVLLAGAERQARRDPSANLSPTISLLRRQFEGSLHEATQRHVREATWLTADQAIEVTAGYAQSIGDLEQTLDGEDQLPDPLLRKFSVAAAESLPSVDQVMVDESVPESAAPRNHTSSKDGAHPRTSRAQKQAVLQGILERMTDHPI